MKQVTAILNQVSYVWDEKSENSLDDFKNNLYSLQEEIKKEKLLLPYKERDLINSEIYFIEADVANVLTEQEFVAKKNIIISKLKNTDIRSIKTVAQIQDFLSKIIEVI